MKNIDRTQTELLNLRKDYDSYWSFNNENDQHFSESPIESTSLNYTKGFVSQNLVEFNHESSQNQYINTSSENRQYIEAYYTLKEKIQNLLKCSLTFSDIISPAVNPSGNLVEEDILQKLVDLQQPDPINRNLKCEHVIVNRFAKDVMEILITSPDPTQTVMKTSTMSTKSQPFTPSSNITVQIPTQDCEGTIKTKEFS